MNTLSNSAFINIHLNFNNLVCKCTCVSQPRVRRSSDHSLTHSLTTTAAWDAFYSQDILLSLPSWWRCAAYSFSCRRGGQRDELLLKHADTARGQSEELCALCMLKVFACWRCMRQKNTKASTKTLLWM